MLMDHNIPVYEKFEAMLEEHSKVILITATGTGKSYIVKEYLDRHNLKALVVCPKSVIKDNWNLISDKVTATTYHKLSSDYKNHRYRIDSIIDKYDIFVFDEAHHIGSPTWTKAFEYIDSLIDNKTNKIIGLTASSRRYLDGDRDVAIEYFNNNIIYGYSQLDAIRNGVLPNAEYITALFNTKEIYDRYNRKASQLLSDSLIGQLDYVFKNAVICTDILKKHMPKNNRKAIIFVDKIDSITDAEILLKSAFGDDIDIFQIHSKLSKKKNKNTIKEFEKKESGYIITVDMLNEGLHINGINTVVMLRHTSSPMIYMQQIGRGLAANNNALLIFDFVCNATSIRSITKDIEFVTDYLYGTNRERNVSDQIIVHDYIAPISEVLISIDSEYGFYKRPYSKEDDALIINHYKEKGSKWCADKLNRSRQSITNRARLLGVSEKNLRIGSISEDDKQFIKNNPNMKIEDVASKLGISYATVQKYRYIFNMTNKNNVYEYTEEVDNLIIMKCGTNRRWVKEVSDITGIPRASILDRSKRLGIYKKVCNNCTRTE